ncbi:MAG: hypothetical protein GXO12_00790 [Epsilonproteobacteria bacterium]|nr:hypothetical protein [Campylobacterota bacterium]
MEKFLECVEEYEKRLTDEFLKIVDDQSIPLTEKNRLTAPLADQKKVLSKMKNELLEIKNKTYEAKCEMYKFQ